jgi:prepilin signal peptidase PulO-like enzyme (type II secretory pathway)
MLPTLLNVGFVFIFGVIIGSFLNVFLYRFHTGRTVMGHSHCLSCGTRLTSKELIPLFSYLVLQGRCLTCSSRIPSRYFLVEITTALLFVMAFLMSSSMVEFAIHALFLVILVLIAVYDIYHMVIPDEFVIGATLVALASELYLLSMGKNVYAFGWDIVAALLASLFLLMLWRVSKGTWIGFGDVKLVVPLAIMVGASSVFSLVVLSFWVGAIIGLLIMAYQKIRERGQPHLRLLSRQLTMKSAVPFAPFLIIAYLIIYLYQIDVVALLTYV